jgi:hypothetical protein
MFGCQVGNESGFYSLSSGPDMFPSPSVRIRVDGRPSPARSNPSVPYALAMSVALREKRLAAVGCRVRRQHYQFWRALRRSLTSAGDEPSGLACEPHRLSVIVIRYPSRYLVHTPADRANHRDRSYRRYQVCSPTALDMLERHDVMYPGRGDRYIQQLQEDHSRRRDRRQRRRS